MLPGTHHLTDAVARPSRLLGLCRHLDGGRGDKHLQKYLLVGEVFLKGGQTIEGLKCLAVVFISTEMWKMLFYETI